MDQNLEPSWSRDPIWTPSPGAWAKLFPCRLWEGGKSVPYMTLTMIRNPYHGAGRLHEGVKFQECKCIYIYIHYTYVVRIYIYMYIYIYTQYIYIYIYVRPSKLLFWGKDIDIIWKGPIANHSPVAISTSYSIVVIRGVSLILSLVKVGVGEGVGIGGGELAA